jgi:heme o synthase
MTPAEEALVQRGPATGTRSTTRILPAVRVPRTRRAARDLLALAKPGITLSNVMAAGAGMALAPGTIASSRAAWVLAGTGLIVAAANTLNMYLERDSDRLMPRTRQRPLPAGRLSPALALAAGMLAGTVGAVLLHRSGGALTAGLGLLGLVGYVLVYTPLKRRTPLALPIGAIPGAIPPVMGWTAVTGSLDVPAAGLFALLALWQLPHFLAIAAMRRDDYAAAGTRTVVAVYGEPTARRWARWSAAALLPVSLLPAALAGAGPVYWLAALGLGVWLLRAACDPSPRWSRRLFLATVIYLPALLGAVFVDRLAG